MSYTRITLAGAEHKAELVVPGNEPLIELLPEMLRLLEEHRASADAMTLTTLLGERLDSSLTLEELHIPHGAILRMVPLAEAPAPPEVSDLTETVSTSLEERPDRWRPSYTTALAGALSAAAGWVIATTLDDAVEIRFLELAAPGLLVLISAILFLVSRPRVGLLAAVSSIGAAGPAASHWADELFDTQLPPLAATALTWAAAVFAIALIIGTAARHIPIMAGGAAGVGLLGLWAGLEAGGIDPTDIPPIIAVVGVVAVGCIPLTVLSISGLTGLDDRAIEARGFKAPVIRAAVGDAYASMQWLTISLTAVTTAALCATAAEGTRIAAALTGSIVIVLIARAKILPLAPARGSVFVAGLTVATTLAITWQQEAAVVILASVLVGVIAVFIVGVNPSQPSAAKLRRYTNLIEFLAVLAIVPLLLAHLGVLADLVEVFR